MIHLKHFKSYIPDNPSKKSLSEAINAIFYRSDDGTDWYDAVSLFNPYTYKVKYTQDGVICSISQDASAICPEDGSVIEIETLPNGCDIYGGWQCIGDRIISRQYTDDELQIQAEQKKQSLLAAAAKAIAPLQDAVDLGEATQDEGARLTVWKKFRVNVNRVDITQLPVMFPPVPKF